MTDAQLQITASLVSDIVRMWRGKKNTQEIAPALGLVEATIYNILAALFDRVRA